MPIHFTADKKTLVSLIQPTMTAVSSRNTLPALEGLLFTLKGSELSVCGYDLEKGVRTVTQVNGLSDGAVILNAQKVFAIVRNFPDCDITFSSDDKNLVSITGGMSEYSIHGLGSDTFPSLPMLGGDTRFTMTQALLKEIIQSTNFAVAQTDARPILTGQLFRVSGSALTVVALDNYRLALRSEKTPFRTIPRHSRSSSPAARWPNSRGCLRTATSRLRWNLQTNISFSSLTA